MSIEVRVPAVLRKHVDEARTLDAEPGFLRDLLKDLSGRYPALGQEVFTEDGQLHRFINVYVNDEDVRYLEGLDTKISEGDVVSILPAVAGGSAGD